MHGIPISRETIAAWHVVPPSSVTIAPAIFMYGTQSGFVIRVTRISLFFIRRPASRVVGTIFALPACKPGLAARPCTTATLWMMWELVSPVGSFILLQKVSGLVWTTYSELP